MAAKQYDMELEIYRNIWKALHDLCKCLDYICDFQHPTVAEPTEYLRRLEEHSIDFKRKLEIFENQMDSVAPFYQCDIYELLCKIDEECKKLMEIFQVSMGYTGMTNENTIIVNSEIIPQICFLKEKLTKDIRDYLFSLQKIPDI